MRGGKVLRPASLQHNAGRQVVKGPDFQGLDAHDKRNTLLIGRGGARNPLVLRGAHGWTRAGWSGEGLRKRLMPQVLHQAKAGVRACQPRKRMCFMSFVSATSHNVLHILGTLAGQVLDSERGRREGARVRSFLPTGQYGVLRRVPAQLCCVHWSAGHRVVPQAPRGSRQ